MPFVRPEHIHHGCINNPSFRLRFPVDSIQFGTQKVEAPHQDDRQQAHLDMNFDKKDDVGVATWSCDFKHADGSPGGRFEVLGHQVNNLVMSDWSEDRPQKTFIVFKLNLDGRKANQSTVTGITAKSRICEGASFPILVAFEVDPRDIEVAYGDFENKAKDTYKILMRHLTAVISGAMLANFKHFKMLEAEEQGREIRAEEVDIPDFMELRTYDEMLSFFIRFQSNSERKASGRGRKRAAVEEAETVDPVDPVAD